MDNLMPDVDRRTELGESLFNDLYRPVDTGAKAPWGRQKYSDGRSWWPVCVKFSVRHYSKKPLCFSGDIPKCA